MKNTFIILLIIISLYVLFSLYFLDKESYICPIEYNRDFVVRCDNRGNGYFGASRNGGRTHNGIDLLADIGTPVKAMRSGRVIAATKRNGIGNYVVICHDRQTSTLYGHLDKIYVRKNQLVRQGDVIGTVGKTGNANFHDILPHLHLEIKKDNVPQEPQEYF